MSRKPDTPTAKALKQNLEVFAYEPLTNEMVDPHDIYEELDRRLLKDAVSEALDTLAERERKVLIARTMGCRTLKEVGQMYGVHSERIRQIEARGLRKLRHPTRSKLIADFVPGLADRLKKEEQERKERKEQERIEHEKWLIEWKAQEAERLKEEEKRLKKEKQREENYQRRLALETKIQRRFYQWLNERIASLENRLGETTESHIYKGMCKCQEWQASYKLNCQSFEIGCYYCQTRFLMERK